jgi:hypothetical protein
MRHFHVPTGFGPRLKTAGLALLVAAALLLVVPARASANKVTKCTALDICYCVNTDYLDTIKDKITGVRQQISDNRKQGKAIGYLSIPISPAGGGSSEVNTRVAKATTDSLTERFGVRSVWLLNPAAKDPDPAAKDPMTGASGADYMYMWTQILEGRNGLGLGEDFDFFYFTGPSDFARFFQVSGPGTLDQLGTWFDTKVPNDPVLKQSIEDQHVTRSGFQNYYGLRASVAFSYGSHDEWNIARAINERRRGAVDFGIANQLAVFFDGQPVTPGAYENPAASGDTGRCIN